MIIVVDFISLLKRIEYINPDVYLLTFAQCAVRFVSHILGRFTLL